MIFGIRVPYFGVGILGGLWLAFIGWFLNNAAVASYQQIVIQDLLEGVPVAQLMRANVLTVSPDTPVSTLVHEYVMGTEDRAFPVVEGDQLLRQIMTPAEQVESAAPREEAGEAIMKLARRDVNQIPVLENGHLIRMLRRRDIVRWLQLHSDGLTTG